MRGDAFSHGVAYVAVSRCTSFNTLGFLYKEKDPDEEDQVEVGRPTFVNYVIQRALEHGVIGVDAPPLAEQVEVQSGTDSGDEERNERAGKKRGKKPEAVGPKRASLQGGAMKLKNRREKTFAAVKHLYK